MTQECTIVVTRSDSWVKAQRLATGTNVPKEIDRKVEIPELSERARAVLLAYGHDSYPARFDGGFNCDFEFSRYSPTYGKIPLLIDSYEPTVAEVDAAIVQAASDLAAKREAHVAEKSAREAEALAKAQQWAAMPLSQRAGADGVRYGTADNGTLACSGVCKHGSIDDLKRLVPDAWQEAHSEWKRLQEIEAGKNAIRDRKILADFLAEIPQDALRGTLKSIAHNGDAIEALRKKVEDASPVVIFSDDDDDETDDE